MIWLLYHGPNLNLLSTLVHLDFFYLLDRGFLPSDVYGGDLARFKKEI
jgi:hypothetical protein